VSHEAAVQGVSFENAGSGPLVTLRYFDRWSGCRSQGPQEAPVIAWSSAFLRVSKVAVWIGRGRDEKSLGTWVHHRTLKDKPVPLTRGPEAPIEIRRTELALII
jgi:hypothetical protein